jgi:heat shock protein HslJ
MRRFVVGWSFGLLVAGLAVTGWAQSGTVNGAIPLEKTEWKLVRLGDAEVKGDDLRQKPEIVLDPGAHRVSGSGGCNRITGGYELKGEDLTFGQMASTMMACPSGMETEQGFLKALGQVKRWKIAGRKLELMDGSGKVVAAFEVGDPAGK